MGAQEATATMESCPQRYGVAGGVSLRSPSFRDEARRGKNAEDVVLNSFQHPGLSGILKPASTQPALTRRGRRGERVQDDMKWPLDSAGQARNSRRTKDSLFMEFLWLLGFDDR
jgi:hypothetical protein